MNMEQSIPRQCMKLIFNGISSLQWLVKKAIERKEEMGDYIREFSVSQFNKFHSTPQVYRTLYVKCYDK